MAFEQVLHVVAMVVAAPAIFVTVRVAVRWLLDRIIPDQKITIRYKGRDGEVIKITTKVDGNDDDFIKLLDEILEKQKSGGHHV
ncbi:hypothetical protein HLBENOHH_02842 [Aeromonas dhakensis]|uniref:hypothetical protein n=1 Tax=Aeromonas TaxID=642 RepID=UPI002B484672|nr:hypothetical protein [Aeromonas veronii]